MMDDKAVRGRNGTAVALGLVFLSGFAALIYQVLWMKQIGLLFGNTSHAASATLASFFAGLAAGSWFLGRRVSITSNPMRIYAWLEAGIAVTALLYFGILAIYQAIYPAIYQSFGSGGLLLPIKFGLSLLLVFPPAFCMGGTIPVIGQYMVRERHDFGRTSALMYGINTLGAAIGAALAGFYLPLWLGFNATCGLAIVVSGGVAVFAFRLSRGAPPAGFQAEEIRKPESPQRVLTRQERRRLERDEKRGKAPAKDEPSAPAQPASAGGRRVVLFLCFLSGFGVLALEVLWTRLFSQVLENSVYTFAAILVVLLVCLALGALISSRLARLSVPPFLMLTLLVLLGAGAVMVTPTVFMRLTDDMQVVSSAGTWSTYILLIFKTAALTIGPSAVLLGTVFPYLMKLEERHLISPGLSLGRLATANTIGAILGALLCGFLLLDWLGMWRSMQVISLVYIGAALVLPLGWDRKSLVAKAACAGVLLVNVFALDPRSLPVMSTDPLAAEERIVEIWEGSDCTVAVTDSRRGLAIKINSHYSLGSTGAYMQEKFQADLPLMLMPETESVFFLGVGTGITAGSALDQRHENVKRVVACELVPEVVTAAKKVHDGRGRLRYDRRSLHGSSRHRAGGGRPTLPDGHRRKVRHDQRRSFRSVPLGGRQSLHAGALREREGTPHAGRPLRAMAASLSANGKRVLDHRADHDRGFRSGVDVAAQLPAGRRGRRADRPSLRQAAARQRHRQPRGQALRRLKARTIET